MRASAYRFFCKSNLPFFVDKISQRVNYFKTSPQYCKNDRDQISPYFVNKLSSRIVMRIEIMINYVILS